MLDLTPGHGAFNVSELSDRVEGALRMRRQRLGGWASSPAAGSVMRANRRRDTAPELQVRRLLHAAGLRFRVDVAPSQSDRRRRADVVFSRRRIAVFVDGCFWHGCPQHFVAPKTNSDYWGPKIARNRERDAETTELLLNEGWNVLRFWEHEDPQMISEKILEAWSRFEQ